MLVLRSDCKMSRYIVEYCVTCGIVICGYPHCLNEIHILRIQHIPLCLVNPQIRLRHLWTVPYFNYKHDFCTKMSQCVCVSDTYWDLPLKFPLCKMWGSHNCLWGYCCSVPPSPWTRGPWTHQHRVLPNSYLPLLPQSSAGVTFVTARCLSHCQCSM